jgi:tripartite-type tricarboxylate transporter receptor subunit TctC
MPPIVVALFESCQRDLPQSRQLTVAFVLAAGEHSEINLTLGRNTRSIWRYPVSEGERHEASAQAISAPGSGRCRSPGLIIPIPDRLESNPTPANGNWIAATASPRVQSDLEAVSDMAAAQAWPARPVRLIVPFPPGGTTDIFARIAAQKLSEHFGKQFYIENIAGATGNVGAAQVARATPDGYTVLFTFSSYVVNPTLFAKLPFDPNKDLMPVTLAVAATNVLTINPSVPARNLGDLIALIKSNPGKYNYASGGVGTQAHLLGEMLRLSLALDIVHVPFNGGGPEIASIVAGHTPIGWSALVSAAQQIKAGQLLALAVASKTRSQLFPEIPTTAEAGYPDIQGDSWVGVLVPAGTPNEIIGLLHREMVTILALPDVKERLPALGFEVVASTPGEFATRIKAEIESWAKVIRAANIKQD